jgi:hypothetical protein
LQVIAVSPSDTRFPSLPSPPYKFTDRSYTTPELNFLPAQRNSRVQRPVSYPASHHHYILTASEQRNLIRVRRTSLLDHIAQDHPRSIRFLPLLVSETATTEINHRLQFGSNERKQHIVLAKRVAIEKTVHPKSKVDYCVL